MTVPDERRDRIFLDYAVPTAARLPSFEIEHVERPDPATPLGMTGMAEGG